MNIKLDALYSGVLDEIILDNSVSFDKEKYEFNEIKDLKNIVINGKIYINSSEELILETVISGIMVLVDSISLENVDYNFSTNIEEILENNENTIDILPILWQNIVLEVPLRFTKVEDFSSYSGDGWKLISEEEVGKNNPFLELKEKYKEEW